MNKEARKKAPVSWKIWSFIFDFFKVFSQITVRGMGYCNRRLERIYKKLEKEGKFDVDG